MKKNKVYALQKYEIGAATLFVQECLEGFGIRPKEAAKGTLIAEEAIGSLILHAADTGELRISVKKSVRQCNCGDGSLQFITFHFRSGIKKPWAALYRSWLLLLYLYCLPFRPDGQPVI